MKIVLCASLLIVFAAALAAPVAALADPIKPGVAVRILPMGDSITEGKPWPDGGGYRKPLQDLLKAAGFNATFVGKEDDGQPQNATGFSGGMDNPNHEGYGSFRIDQMTRGGGAEGHTAPAIAVTLASDKPDVILLMLGTNDLLQDHDLTGLLGRMDTLVGDIFAYDKSIKLLIAQPTPMSGPRGEKDAVYASGIPLIAAKYKALGYDITVVDMYDALDPALDLCDGIHPRPIGYAKMANVWFQALTGIAPKPIEEPVHAAATAASPSPAASVPAAAQSVPGVSSAVPAGVSKGGAMTFQGAAFDGAGGPFVLGWDFKTGPSDVTVTALGYLNDGATGAAATHQVGIFDCTTQSLIGEAQTVTTTGGDTTGNNATFTYVKLDKPIVLKANGSYAVGGSMIRTGFLKRESGVVLAPGIVPGSAVASYAAAHGLVFPEHTIGGNGSANLGPNFLTADQATTP